MAIHLIIEFQSDDQGNIQFNNVVFGLKSISIIETVQHQLLISSQSHSSVDKFLILLYFRHV